MGPFITERVRSTTVRYCFHRCLSVHREEGVPRPGPNRGGGRGYPKVPTAPSEVPTPPPPSQVRTGGGVLQCTYPRPRYLPPLARSQWGGTQRYLPHQLGLDGRRGYPKVPTPPPPPAKVPMPPARSQRGGGGTRYLSPMARSGWGEGYPKVPTYPPPPPPRDRTVYGVLDTLWSVCLLRFSKCNKFY